MLVTIVASIACFIVGGILSYVLFKYGLKAKYDNVLKEAETEAEVIKERKSAGRAQHGRTWIYRSVRLHGGKHLHDTVGRDPEYSGGSGGSGPDVKKDKFGFLLKFCCTHLRNPDIIQMSGQQVQTGRLQ